MTFGRERAYLYFLALRVILDETSAIVKIP